MSITGSFLPSFRATPRWLGALSVAGYLLAAVAPRAAVIPGLFHTGVDNAGALLPAGSVDPHYRLFQSADAGFPGPSAYVVNDAWPVQSGVWMLNGPTSKWLAPQASQATGNLPGDYVFRLTFDLTGLDPDTAVITGRWSSDNGGVDIRINGVGTGINYDGNFGAFSASWTISSGFVEGTNTLDFVVNNAGTTANPIGFRAELSGTADFPPPPGTPPTVTEQPQPTTVFLQDPATFSVKAYGSRPFRYQWRRNGNPVPGATNASYTIDSVTVGDAGAYDVVVSNDAGAATSLPATLTAVFTSPAEPVYEPLGPSNRRSGLAFTEMMYHPRDREDGLNLEFIEIYNSNPWPEDLSGWHLGGDLDFTFPDDTTIPGLGLRVVAPVPADIEAFYEITGVLGGFTNNLPNGGGTIRLVKRSGGIVLDVTYSDQPPWPAAADGAGHSLALVRASFGDHHPKAWAASAFLGGSPGAVEPLANTPQDFVVINELLAHTDPPLTDFVELYNYSPFTADLSGCWLTDERNTNKFRIPDGTVLLPQGFVAFDEATLGFALGADGETIYLVNSNQTRVIDAVRFDGQAQGVSYGRTPDGAATFSFLAGRTPGASNGPIPLPPVVINELMFNPISRDGDDEYLELFNRSIEAVNLGGWRLNQGISFNFPSNTVLPAGAYLVVARDAARLRTNYAGLTAANCLGDYGGNLGNGGERITLERPDSLVTTNAITGRVTTNNFHIVVSEVAYFDRSRWSRFADGGGSSLELVDVDADTRLAANWADSDESDKAPPWTLVEFTGLVDNAMPGVSADQVQLFLLGEGEALVDDVEVISSGVNRVPNPGFETGTNGWVFQGTQIRSSWETNGGYNSARSLHLRASDRGEPIINRVRAPLSTTISLSSTVTLRARVRWLAGTPEFLMRLHGGGIEATARLNVPGSLGTPGAPNSRARVNAGPVITEISHRPVLPQANQTIRVVARVQDPDGVTNVTLRYRLDPASTLIAIAMRDDGTGADLLAGDGIFSASIPGQARDTMVAFRIEATDGAGATAQFPAEAPARECFVRVGDQFISGPFGNYRIWMTQATLNHWATRGNLSNDPLDVTCVYGQSRVVYNAASLYAGSPAWSPQYNSPVGNLCAYDILFPGDDPVLNEDKFSLDIPIRDATNQREQLMHWIADRYDLPNLYRRDVHLFVNGVKRGTIYHDTQQPDGDLLDEWFSSDPDGTLVKAAQWSEGDDVGNVQSILLPSIERFPSGGALKVAAYRWPWRLRAADSQIDYTNFLSLVEAANTAGTGTPYQSAVEGLVNIEDWMRMFAMNDLCSFWDAVGNPNKKNTYIYKPLHSTWRTIPWDFDVGLGVFNDPVDAALFPGGVDPTIQRMYNFPAFVRIYWRELEFGANTIFPDPAITTILTTKYDGYRTNGLNFTSPFVASGAYGLSVPGWIAARRTFLQGQLNTVAASFALLSQTNFSTNRNVALITGNAPVGVKTILANGAAYPISWTTATRWTLQVPLEAGTNVLEIAGLDRADLVLSNTLRSVTVNYTGADEPAEDRVVITEIMYNPLVPESSYLELFNRSTNYTFNLSGWRLNGIDFTFPSGTLIAPRTYVVLAKNRQAFAQVYGTGIPVLGEFAGQLDDGGETLTLLAPGSSGTPEVVIDRVTYDDDAPWLTSADGSGAALQLIDPGQDNSRVSNWATDAGRWRQAVLTGTLQTTSTNLAIWLNSAGNIYIDDVWLVPGSQAEVGPNLLQAGDFEGLPEGPLGGPWFYAYFSQIVTTYTTNGSIVITNYSTNQVITATNMTNSVITRDVARSGNASLHVVSKTVGGVANSLRQAIPPPPASATNTLSFWFLSSTNGTNITVRPLSGSLLSLVTNYRPPLPSSPGTTNSVVGTLPPYPPLWLSEVQPENLTGPADGAGDRDPWIELHNAGPDPISLEGMSLADNYTNLNQWVFPAGAVMNPGQYLVVWADGEPGESTETEFHSSFRLPPANGTVVLSRTLAGELQILDYFNYLDVDADRSYGAYPPAQVSYRQGFYYPTPGSSNNPSAPPVTLFINEWMAANQSFLPDPMDGNYDDWFEIYNPGTNAVDLTGFRLTDTAASPNKFTVPTNIFVPPQGYLLVWADEDSGQTRTNGDLHVNFRLSQGGEAIQLRDPLGRLVDAVVFGRQTNNISQGRYPDGTATLSFMTTPTPRAPNVHAGCAAGEIRVLGLIFDGPTVTLAWTAQPGCTYRVQYKDDLGAADWSDLPGDITADGPVAVKSDTTVAGSAQRFYRVVGLGN